MLGAKLIDPLVNTLDRGQIATEALEAPHLLPSEQNRTVFTTAQTDQDFNWFYEHKSCWDKNVMVCKHCTARDLRNVTLHQKRPDMEIWCFDHGVFFNDVSSHSAICKAACRGPVKFLHVSLNSWVGRWTRIDIHLFKPCLTCDPDYPDIHDLQPTSLVHCRAQEALTTGNLEVR